MKVIPVIILLLVVQSSTVWGATVCKTIEYPDHDEAICIGDEKYISETKAVNAPPLRDTTENISDSRKTPSWPAPPKTQQTTAAPSTAPSIPDVHPICNFHETTSEHLARRKALAIKNTNALSVNITPPAPSIK